MTISEVSFRQRGFGYLILKSGSSKRVGWEIELAPDDSIGSGWIWGDEEHLQAAADDGCAVLHISLNMSAAIAIEHYKDGEATFSNSVGNATSGDPRLQLDDVSANRICSVYSDVANWNFRQLPLRLRSVQW